MRVLPDVLFLLFDMIHLNLTQDKNNFSCFFAPALYQKVLGQTFLYYI